MLPWFLSNPTRLERERREIELLAATAPWFVGYDWQFRDGLVLDAVLRVHEHDYQLRVIFPTLYPDAPAVVRPLHEDQRLSTHQYGGADGPLCLQWGPDNWHSDIGAVQMLESAYLLLEVENPLGQDRPELKVVAPSRHHLSLGQDVRGEWARCYVSAALEDFLANRPDHAQGSFRFSFRKLRDSWCALIHAATEFGNEPWQDSTIPATLSGATESDRYSGAWIKTDLEPAPLRAVRTLDDLRSLVADGTSPQLLATDGSSPVEGLGREIAGVLICDREDRVHLFVVLAGGRAIHCMSVQGHDTPTLARAPASSVLGNKRIAVIGLGSAGSKIAISLARMGVGKFYLVDHDILLPENLQRHAVDWRGVTEHKVDAVASALGEISATVDVVVSRIHLTGQESNAVVNGVLAHVSECDLIVDATANARVFNLTAAVSLRTGKPLVWLEIFAGGVGGMVARSRPGVDASAQDMRTAYLGFCSDNPAPSSLIVATDYSDIHSDSPPLVASDADVSVIANHAARFVSDYFLAGTASAFPYSMYLIGLAKVWVFHAPFATIPISMESLPVSAATSAIPVDFPSDTLAFLLQLFDKTKA